MSVKCLLNDTAVITVKLPWLVCAVSRNQFCNLIFKRKSITLTLSRGTVQNANCCEFFKKADQVQLQYG